MTNPIPFDAVALGSDETPAASTTDSLVTCENDAGNNDDECPDSRLQKSGSMQMKVFVSQARANGCQFKHQAATFFALATSSHRTSKSTETKRILFHSTLNIRLNVGDEHMLTRAPPI